jgi:hypothetical protein
MPLKLIAIISELIIVQELMKNRGTRKVSLNDKTTNYCNKKISFWTCLLWSFKAEIISSSCGDTNQEPKACFEWVIFSVLIFHVHYLIELIWKLNKFSRFLVSNDAHSMSCALSLFFTSFDCIIWFGVFDLTTYNYLHMLLRCQNSI